MFSSASVVCVPGALTVLAWHPRRTFDLFELVGLAFAVSFGIGQLITMAALLAHWSPPISLTVLGALMLVAAAFAWRRRDAVVVVDRHHLPIAIGLAIVAVYLYAIGSSYGDVEDRIHVAIVERLAFLRAPSFRNIYFAPNVVYTYPFPGTHYLMALIARLGDIPALFVYAKLRPVWAVAAAVLLYGSALIVFGSIRIAAAATITATALVANGAFATASSFWGQMAPFSHASDVAMNVLLPALLLLTFETFRSTTRREYWFSVSAALALVLMIVIVHTREIVQFVVYVAAFAGILAFARGPQQLLWRSLGMLSATVMILILYRAWNMWAVPLVDALVAAHRVDLRDLFHAATWPELFGQPLPLMRNYMPNFEPTFYGSIPLVLLLTPAILFAARGRALTWFIAASVACYALIVRFPAFAIPYTYVTYFEILYSPIRNFVFFVYLLAGVGLYMVAALLSRLSYAVLLPLALAAGLLIAGGIPAFGSIASQHIDFLFAPLLIGCGFLFLTLIRTKPQEREDIHLFQPGRRWVVAFATMLAIVAYGTRVKDAAVITARWHDAIPTPTALLASASCTADREFCAPPPALIRFAEHELPTEGVLAVDLHERIQPALFMPQQMVIWTGSTDSLLDPETIFPAYFRHLKLAQGASLDQPLFNTSETRAQRTAFVRDLGVTHVLVNPRLYSSIKPVFEGDADLFVSRYDDGKWAVYEVTRK
jgi:hypothetical protein